MYLQGKMITDLFRILFVYFSREIYLAAFNPIAKTWYCWVMMVVWLVLNSMSMQWVTNIFVLMRPNLRY